MKILIVDDRAFTRHMISKLLIHGGLGICIKESLNEPKLTYDIPVYCACSLIPNQFNEKYFKYNYHDQFKEFGISKKEKFKKIKIRRKI